MGRTGKLINLSPGKTAATKQGHRPTYVSSRTSCLSSCSIGGRSSTAVGLQGSNRTVWGVTLFRSSCTKSSGQPATSIEYWAKKSTFSSAWEAGTGKGEVEARSYVVRSSLRIISDIKECVAGYSYGLITKSTQMPLVINSRKTGLAKSSGVNLAQSEDSLRPHSRRVVAEALVRKGELLLGLELAECEGREGLKHTERVENVSELAPQVQPCCQGGKRAKREYGLA